VYLRYASVLSCLLTGMSRAQSAATATIVGKVVDPQGANQDSTSQPLFPSIVDDPIDHCQQHNCQYDEE
jgi:hypothetical protein